MAISMAIPNLAVLDTHRSILSPPQDIRPWITIGRNGYEIGCGY